MIARYRIPAGLLLTLSLSAQPAAIRPFQNQSASTINYTTTADGYPTVEIHNVSYEVTGTNIPGRPPGDRLVLRKTAHSKQTLGDIGEEATVTLEAWRLGGDPAQKPLYTIAASGTDGHTLDNALFVAARGLEEVDWWSVYKLGSGQHLFDTYVPLLSFSISRETLKTRYVGLEIPPDNTTDPRLKQPNVVCALSYASEDRVIREVLLTSDDAQQAQLLRSFADVTRSLALEEQPPAPGRGSGQVIKIAFRQNYPSPANALDVLIPVQGDDLDLAHTVLPAGLHVSVWRRGRGGHSVRK